MALLEGEDAVSIVEEAFAFRDWPKRMRERRLLAAVEIKCYGYNEVNLGLNESKALIHKLTQNHDQVKYGYIVIACYARKMNRNPSLREPCDLEALTQFRKKVEEGWVELCYGKQNYIQIYWTSDHSGDKPGWLGRHL